MGNSLFVDIGGTNLRYAFVESTSEKFSKVIKKKIDESISADLLIEQILKEIPIQINNIVFSIAGPKLNNTVEMTNRNLKIDPQTIKTKYVLNECFILNDWEAIAYSFLNFEQKSLFNLINENKQSYNDNILCVGPGTGLGAAMLVKNEIALATEIGNINFGIKDLIGDKYYSSGEFRKIEDVLSGPAISRFYQILTDKNLKPEEIIKLAISKEVNALEVVNDFLKRLARFLAKLSLIYLPGKGIYLSGSIVRSLKDFIIKKDFEQNYLLSNKNTPQHKILENTVINIIDQEHLALYGCLNYFNLTQKV